MNWYVNDALGTDDLSHGTGPEADAFKSLYYAVVESGLPDNGDVINVAAATYNPIAPIAIIKSLRSLGNLVTPSNVLINAPLTAGLYDRDCFQVLANGVTIEGHKLVGAMDDKPDHHPAWGQPGRQNAGIMVGSDVTLTTHGVLKGVSGGKFSYNEIVDGSKSMFLYHAKDCEVSHNDMTTTKGKDPDNFYDILGWNGDGIHVYLESPSDYPTGNIISYNTMDNVRVGVFLNGDSIAGIDPSAWDFRGTLIERNVLSNLWNAGIILQCASGVEGFPIIIRLNEIYTSTGRRAGDEGNERGLISVHGDYVEILQNILTGSEEHGIWADGHHLIVATNTLTLHTKDGVIVGAYKKVEPNNGWTLPEITREDIVVEINAIQECRVGVKVCDGSNKDISIIRNLIEECLVAGVSFQEELEDLKVVGNEIKNNPVGVACDVVGEKSLDTRIHLNCFEGNVVGVKNDYQVAPQEIDARFNWWGSPDGPGGVGPGQGDPVTDHVLYEPFLTCCPVHGSCKVEVVEGDSPVVSNPDAGITLEGIDLTYGSSGLLGSVKLEDVPVTAQTFEQGTKLRPIKFIDVFGTGLASGKVRITVDVTQELNAGLSARSLQLYMWYGGAWHLGEGAGVNVVARTVWGTFNATDLNGSPGGVGAESHTNWVNVIKNYVDTLETAIGAIEGATTLHNKLTKARADLLDEITAARLEELDGANIPGDIDTLITRVTAAVALASSQARVLCSMDFWSDMVEEIVVTGAQATPAITGGNVVIADLPDGATIVRAVVMMKYRMVENDNAAENSLDADAPLPMQVDDVANNGWLSCIDFVDEMCKIAATTREGGDVIIGDIDVAARVDGNDTYDFQWLNAKAHLANLRFNDVQMGIRIWYSI